MCICVPQIDDFRLKIWLKLNEEYIVKKGYNVSDSIQNLLTDVLMSIHFDAFHIFGFLDDT